MVCFELYSKFNLLGAFKELAHLVQCIYLCVIDAGIFPIMNRNHLISVSFHIGGNYMVI